MTINRPNAVGDGRIQSRRQSAPRVAPESARLVWIAFALSLILGLLVYKPALHGQFVFDDLHLPFSDPAAPRMGIGFWLGGVRPVLMLTYWLNFVISGGDTYSYHLLNVLIHAVNAALVFAVVRRLVRVKDSGVLADAMAWFCAGIFLLHPLQTEAVSYIAGRSELMGALFFLLTWLTFLNSRETLSLGRCLVVISLAGCAVLSKESAISIPLVLFASDVFRFEDIRAAFAANRWFYWILGLAAVGGAIAILVGISGQAGTGLGSGSSPLLYAFSETRAIWLYVRLFFLPIGQNGDWGLPLYGSVIQPEPLACTAAIVGAALLFYRFGRRNPLFILGVCVFALTLAPSSSFIPLPDVAAERRMYVPIVGLALAIAALLPRKPMSSPAAAWLVLPLAFLGTISSARATVWADRFVFWDNSVKGNPENSRAHFGLGAAYAERRQYDKALEEFNIVRRAKGDTPQVLANIAEVLQARGSVEQALVELRTLVRLAPKSSNYTNLGLAEARLGYSDQAMLDFDAALRLNSENAIAYAYRGMAEASLKRQDDAIRDVRRARTIDPDNEIVRYAISQVEGSDK